MKVFYQKNSFLLSYATAPERKNLTFRTRIKRLVRRTICFSKSLASLYQESSNNFNIQAGREPMQFAPMLSI
ncbi:MAG: IS1 family transposase [Endozoicomonas sp. (ex Botrylloides leachii)]|nr:IS1 family transposase [Endozoicomonas sp. (ex Botrylloides leachii)]